MTLTERALCSATRRRASWSKQFHHSAQNRMKDALAPIVERYAVAVNRLTERYYREQSRHNESGRA